MAVRRIKSEIWRARENCLEKLYRCLPNFGLVPARLSGSVTLLFSQSPRFTTMKPKSSLFSAASLFVAFSSFFPPGSASAADIVWGTNLGAGPWVWNTGGNWIGGTAPVISADRGDLRKDWTAAAAINLNAPTTINGILFEDTGATGDVAVTIGNGGTATNTLTLAGTTPGVVATGTLNVTSVLAGSTAWSKSGTGTLNLNNLANTNTGSVSVTAGTLQLGTLADTKIYAFPVSSLSVSAATLLLDGSSGGTHTHTYNFSGNIASTSATDPLTAIQISGSNLNFTSSNATTKAFNGRINFTGTNIVNYNSTNYTHFLNFNRALYGSGSLTFNYTNNASFSARTVNVASGLANNYTGSVILNNASTSNGGVTNFNLASSLGATSYEIRNGWRLNNNAANAISSAASITLVNATSQLNVSSSAWNNPGASLTVTNGTVTLGSGANAGTASIGTLSGAAGSIVTAGTAVASSSLTINQTADASFAGTLAPITGTSLTLTKNGASRLTLSNATPFAGAGTVPLLLNNGTLAFGNGITTLATANISSLAQAGGDLHFDINATSSDVLNISGNYTHSGGGITVAVGAVPALGTPYNLVNYVGNLSGSPAITVLGLAGTRLTATTSLGDGSADAISITFNGGPGGLVWSGAIDNVWDKGTTANWLNGVASDTYLDFDNVTFDDTASGANLSPVLDASITPSSVTFNNDTKTYLLTGTGSIGGTGGVTKSNSGSATIATNNAYTGGTDVLGGTLFVGNSGTTGSLGSGVTFVEAGATLAFRRTDTVTPLANTLSGSGVIAQSGSGTLALSATQSFNGTLVGNSGVIQIGDTTSNTPNTSISSAAGITIKSGAILDLPRLHTSQIQGVTWSLPALDLESGSTLRFRASTGSNAHTVAANIEVTDFTTINNNGGGYEQNITLGGVLSGSGDIDYLATSASGSATALRTLNISNSANTFTGDWLVDYTVATSDDFVVLQSSAAGALGTGKVTLDDRAQLTSSTPGGLNSITGVTLQKATSTASFGTGWTNPAGVLTVTDGNINIGTLTSFSSLNIASLDQAGGTINLELGELANSNDKITVSGDADFAGGQILANPLSNPDDLTYDIVVYGGSLIAPPVVNADAGRLVPAVNLGSGVNDKVTLSFTGNVATLAWRGNDVTNPNNWNTNVTTNWDNAGTPDKFLTFDNVVFDDTATSFTPAVIGTLKPTTVTFNNSANPYTLSGTGSITGASTLIKNGSNTVTISNPNSFTGTVTINAGTLRTANASALGTTAAGTIVKSGGTLDLNALNLGSELITLDGGSLINGGATEQQQAFTRITAASNSSIGGTSRWDVRGATAVTTINSGATLTKVDSNLIYLGVVTGSQVVNNGTVQVNAGTLGIWQSTISGSGSFTVKSGASLAIESAASNPLAVTLAGGTLGNLTGSSASTQGGNITLTADSIIQGGNVFNVTGAIGETDPASYGITVPATGGTVNLSGANTFTGGLSVGPTSATATTVTLASTGTLTVGATKQIRVGNTIAGGLTTQTFNVDGAVSNAGTLNVARPGVLNIRSGGTWNQSGTATIGGIGGYSAAASVNGSASFTYTNPSTFKINPADTNSGNATLTIAGTFTTSSGFERTVATSTGNATISLLSGGTIALGANVPALTTGNVLFTLGTGGGVINTSSFNTTLASNITGTTTSLTKIGSGTLTLAGTNTYTGPTWLDAGNLAGTGASGSALTAESGTTLAPGVGLGNFLAAGATLMSGSTLAIEINSTTDTADKLVSTAAVDITGANVSFTEIGSGTIPAGTKLTILDYTGTTLAGTFNGYAEGASVAVGANTFTLSYADSSKVTLTSTTVGSPYTTWASASGLDGSPGKDPAFDADPDGDGFDNGLEWILGGNPLGADGGTLITTTASAAGGLTLAFNREEDSIGNAVLTVEYDTDLAGTWTNYATVGATSSGPVTINTASDPDAVSVNIPASNAVDGKLFGRLKAVQP